MEDFSTLPSLAETIRLANLRPDKSLGQHFLLDADLLAGLAAAAGDLAGVNVIEIGPGPGGLTRALLATAAASVTAVEYDSRAVAALAPLAAAAGGRLRVLQGDALKTDLPQLVAAPRAIVANLPYNVGSPLLVRWLHEAASYRSMTLMFQREVAERICAAPGTGAYGRLSVLTQWLCEASIAAHVPAAAFTPPPKVDSALVHLVPHAVQPGAQERAAMERLTAAAFGQRRKMLRGALRGIGGEALLVAAGIDPQRRAETLRVAEFVALASEQGKGLRPLTPLGAARPDPHS
jgi:16S rRNA (adenine1518-N6/adenine1519-N6)-dimethyltransferase